MELRPGLGVAHGLEHADAVLHRHGRVVGGVNQEGGRGLCRDVALVRGAVEHSRRGRLAHQRATRAPVRPARLHRNHGADQNREVRARRQRLRPVEHVGGTVGSGCKARRRPGRYVPACGEAKHTHARGVHAPARRMGANHTYRALHVLQRGLGSRRPPVGRQAVEQFENSVTVAGEIVRHRARLRDADVAAALSHHQGRAVRLRGPVNAERRIGDARHHSVARVRSARRVPLRGQERRGPRDALGP